MSDRKMNRRLEIRDKRLNLVVNGNPYPLSQVLPGCKDYEEFMTVLVNTITCQGHDELRAVMALVAQDVTPANWSKILIGVAGQLSGYELGYLVATRDAQSDKGV